MKTVRFILCLMIIVEVRGAPTGGKPADELTKLSKEENEERLQNCGREYSPNDAMCKEDCWAGRLAIRKAQSFAMNKNYGAVLISPRHLLVSSKLILSFTREENQLQFNGEKTGVGCSEKEPRLSSKPATWVLGFPNSTDRNKKFEVGVKNVAYFGRCSNFKDDGIMIIELGGPVDLPYACVPDETFYDDIENKEVHAAWIVDKGDGLPYVPSKGKLEKCDQRINDGNSCWKNDGSMKAWSVTNTISLPLLAKNHDETTTLVGLAHRYYKGSKSFSAIDLKDFTSGLCDYIGVCAAKTTEAPPTTTTTPEPHFTTTTPKPPTTTIHVPQFLLDEEMQDFEEPYHRKQRVKSGANSWRITVVLMMITLVL